MIKTIEEFTMSEEMASKLTLENIGHDVFDPFLEGFKLTNPDDYFKD